MKTQPNDTNKENMEMDHLEFPSIEEQEAYWQARQAREHEREMRQEQFDICKNYHGGNAHSVAANQKAGHGKDKARNAILAQLRAEEGLSCEQLESLTGLSHQSCSARISELKRGGLIVVCGSGLTKTGSKCALYRVV